MPFEWIQLVYNECLSNRLEILKLEAIALHGADPKAVDEIKYEPKTKDISPSGGEDTKKVLEGLGFRPEKPGGRTFPRSDI